MARKPTTKQKKFVKELVQNGGNGVQAALAAYGTDDYNTANQIAVENLQKPTVREELARLWKKHDLSLEDAVEAIKDTVVQGNKPEVRLNSAEKILKLAGAYQNQQHHKHAHLHLQLINRMSELDPEELLSLAEGDLE